MPLPASMDATWLDGSVQFNGQELRRADSGLFVGEGSAPLGVYGGIARHNDNSLAVTVNASDLITIQPGACAIPGNAGVGNGVYRTALGAAETGQLAARNATNPRIDRVIFRVLDTSVVGSHGAYTGRIEVLTGTPAASPAVPALPTLAIELARITVPATGGGVATVDSSWRQYLAAIGGVLPVPTAARLPVTPNAKWLKAVAIDTGREYTWDGTSWDNGAWIPYTPTYSHNAGSGAILDGAYSRHGRTINFRARIRFGSGFTLAAAAQLGLPVQRANYGGMDAQAHVSYLDTGSANYNGIGYMNQTGVSFWVPAANNSYGALSYTNPFTWVAGDEIWMNGAYEASA